MRGRERERVARMLKRVDKTKIKCLNEEVKKEKTKDRWMCGIK